MEVIPGNSVMVFLKKRLLFIIIIVFLVAGGMVGRNAVLVWGAMVVDRVERDSQQNLTNLNTELAATIERKAAEKRAAASATAELVTTIDTTQAEKVDAAICNIGGGHADPTLIDVVVNKKHCMQPLTFAPTDLVTVNGATLSAKASDSFAAMFNAATAAGQGFSVTSSYRSFNDQVSTYQYWVNQSGVNGADTYSARPGYSEHQTGFVIDVAAPGCVLDCFGTTSQYQWMQQHAAEYGFIQRYYAGSEAITGYSAEEWHYRYVGKDVALALKQKGIKTLEEYWNVEGGNY